MRIVLDNHIRPYAFDELFSKNKVIKDMLRELLMKYDERFTYKIKIAKNTINIVNGLSNLNKIQIFKGTREPINNYLKDLLNGDGDNKNYDKFGKSKLILKGGDKLDN